MAIVKAFDVLFTDLFFANTMSQEILCLYFSTKIIENNECASGLSTSGLSSMSNQKEFHKKKYKPICVYTDSGENK